MKAAHRIEHVAQTWRASVIPLLVPVSIIGTFAVLLLLGFTINTLALFGLVLAIEASRLRR